MGRVVDICKKTKEASFEFGSLDSSVKNLILTNIKLEVLKNTSNIIAANKVDISLAKDNKRDAAFIDRLTLNESRIEQMCAGIDVVKELTDPAGEIVESYVLPNGLNVDKVRSPLGVIAIIFEARPNVALDASILCIKSGNGVVLRGSRESVNSVRAIVDAIKKGLNNAGVSEDLVGLIDSSDRQATIEMLKQDKFIDVVIPRGGEGLKKVVLENASMPVLASAGGNCHMYLSSSANIEMAKMLVLNAKVSRPGVCNALETLLVDKSIAKDITKVFAALLKEHNVEVRGDKESKYYCQDIKLIDEDEYYVEYSALIIKFIVVDGIEEAISHINRFGTHHSDAIISEDKNEIKKFLREVDSAVVYVNASTRFTDGFELGLGAEMGISTQKLHVRGPIGIKELTSLKYIVSGNGQIR